MDYNGMLSEEQLSEVEWETNRAIAENLPVRVFFPDKEEEKRLDYRSKKEVEGALRLVEIPGYDPVSYTHLEGTIGINCFADDIFLCFGKAEYFGYH